jgi:phosphoribosylglycinamide formyltransferase-1
MGLRTVVLVSGGGTNLQAIVDQVAAGRLPLDLAAVISDRPGVLALERAARAGIPAQVIDYQGLGGRDAFDPALGAALGALAPGLVVLAGFMRILPTGLVSRYAGRMLNVHPSLLPAYPGLHTYRRALDAGEKLHGSTVHFVIPALDAGPGIIQYRVAIHPGETEASLKARVQLGEYLIYPRAIAWFAAGRLAFADGRAWLDGEPLDGPVIVEERPGGVDSGDGISGLLPDHGPPAGRHR